MGDKREYQLSVFEESAISTVNQEWDTKFLQENNVRNFVRTVPGITLQKLLEEHFPTKGPDFLNIDIEGADLEALKSGNLNLLPRNLRPVWILVESNAPLANTVQNESVQLLVSWGYEVWLILPFACLLKLAQE